MAPVSLRMPRRRARQLPRWLLRLRWPALAIGVTALAVLGADERPAAWRIAVAVVAIILMWWGSDKAATRLSGDFPQRHPWLFAGAQTISVVALIAVTVLFLNPRSDGAAFLLFYGVMWFFSSAYKAKRGEDARYDHDFPLMSRRDALDDRDDGRRWRTGTP